VGWTEDRIHRWLRGLPPARGFPGVSGNDTALLPRLSGRPILCADQTVEGVHYAPSTAPRLVGRKASARALSDLAATAARPRAILVALCAPPDRSAKWIEAVLAGARSMAREHGADLVGGDLACARGPAGIAVAALGETTGGEAPPARDRVRPGQAIGVTGSLGGSRLGRHLRIRPRFDAAGRLVALGATGMMDVSDGLAWDLFRLARASKVRIEVDLARVPVHADARRLSKRDGRTALDHALHDGEDHELVVSLPASAARIAARRLRGFRILGRARRGSGLWLRDATGDLRPWRKSEGGFEHGR